MPSQMSWQEIGGLYGASLFGGISRSSGRRIEETGQKVMCWGMIGWNYQGPFHIWEKGRKEEKADAAAKIAALNAGWF